MSSESFEHIKILTLEDIFEMSSRRKSDKKLVMALKLKISLLIKHVPQVADSMHTRREVTDRMLYGTGL